jgi:Protein of unknown function (DUF3822)
MGKVILDITVQGLHDDYLRHAHAHILLGPERLAYLVSDTSNKILAVKAMEISGGNTLANALESNAMLRNSFAEVTIGIQNKQHTIVPNRMFDPTRLAAYFNLLSSTVSKANTYFGFDDLPALDAKLVYAIEPEIKAAIDKKWPQARVVHHMTAMLEASRAQCNASTFNVFVNVYLHDMQMIIFDGTDLLHFNVYRFNSPSDFVYFLLLPLKQLQIDPTQVSIVMSGEITEESDCIMIAQRFTGPFRYMQLPRMFDYPGAVQSLPSHFCADLYSLKLKK